jgi:flagellar hook assembly protein FlgD
LRESIAEPGRVYTYRIAARDPDGHETWMATTQGTARGPIRLSMARPWPNPFDRRTQVAFTLPGASTVRVTITDVHGRLVRRLVSGFLGGGGHAASWDGRNDGGRAVSANSRYHIRLLRPAQFRSSGFLRFASGAAVIPTQFEQR